MIERRDVIHCQRASPWTSCSLAVVCRLTECLAADRRSGLWFVLHHEYYNAYNRLPSRQRRVFCGSSAAESSCFGERMTRCLPLHGEKLMMRPAERGRSVMRSAQPGQKGIKTWADCDIIAAGAAITL